MSAPASRPSSRRSHCTCEPSPAGSPRTTISKMPPRVSPAAFAASMRAFMRTAASGSQQLRSALFVTPMSSSRIAARFTASPPISVTCDATVIPSSRSSAPQTAPTATRMVVSRALDRSRMSRASVRSYFNTPVRSACPGRTAVTFAPAGAPKGSMRSVQFSKSRLTTCKVSGEPRVSPNRIPESTVTRSVSIFMRSPRPYPRCLRASASSIAARGILSPAGTPSSIAVSAAPCDSPAVIKRSPPIDIPSHAYNP